MAERTLIIKITNDGIYLNPGLLVPGEHTNIPFLHLRFQEHEDIYWQVDMLSFSETDQSLKIRVKDYNVRDIASFAGQQPKAEIRKLLFEKLDWRYLSPLLGYYQKINLAEVIENLEHNPFDTYPGKDRIAAATVPENILILGGEAADTLTLSFDVPFSEAQIGLGHIRFKYRLEQTGEDIEIRIGNSFLLPEFEMIKFWFARKLKTRKFKVYSRVVLVNNTVQSVEASSKEIYKINDELIESIKYQRVLGLTKKPFVTTIDKSLFTPEDIFGHFDEDYDTGNVFGQSEEDILRYLIEHTHIRNKQQLAYLAGKKHSANFKLRFTLHPHFGFLFLAEGRENNHFIWELLDSNATYVWSFGKQVRDIEWQYGKIEETINIIRASGRDSYRRAYTRREIDFDMIFKVIKHEDISSNVADHFPKWKSRLEEQLI